jgi:hypothetical protein
MNGDRDPKRTQLSDAERERLVAYLDGELDDAAEQQVVADLGVRPELRREADTLKKTWELLDFLPKPAATPRFTEQTMQKLQVTKLLLIKREQWWRRLAVVGWLAAVILVGLLGFALVYYWPLRGRAALHATLPQTSPSAGEPRRSDVPEGPALREDQRLLVQMRLEIDRVTAELRNRAEAWELAELQRRRRLGALIFMEELLRLATKYGIPLQRPLTPGAAPGAAPGAPPPLAPRDEEAPGPRGTKKELKKSAPTRPGEGNAAAPGWHHDARNFASAARPASICCRPVA